MPNLETFTPPPYVSFGVFKSTIEQLAENTVPTGPLDRRVLDWLSGADYGALVSALRFLGLVDQERKATSSLRGLVDASKDRGKFMDALLEIITAKYEPILREIDLKGGTITELEKAFKDYGVASGQMLTKSVRFLLKGFQEVGFPVSPHITKAKPKGPRTPKNGNEKGRTRTIKESAHESDFSESPKGFDRMPIPGVANAFIQYPLELTDAHCKMFEAMITALRTYAQSRSGGKEKKP